jgi:hypothetical protein
MNAMMMHCFKLFCLTVLVLLAVSPSVCSQTPPRAGTAASVCAARGAGEPAPVVLAQGWGIGRYFSGTGGRTRVVQLCVVTMCIALFIMMRKLN